MATITGTTGSDVLLSENDGDEIFGLEGDDSLISTHNDVLLDGGADVDTLFTSGDNNTLVGGAGDDNFTSTEAADGTIMDGGAGSDFLIGGGTNDTASYASATTAGVTVDLNTFSANDGSGGLDSLFGIENVIGSGLDDNLRGDDFGANVLRGAGGNDVLFGGAGADTFDYSFEFTAGEADTFTFTEFFAARGGNVVNGEVADGTSMGQFASSYAQWLHMLVKEEGLGTGGRRDLTQFGDPESFTWKSGNGKKAVTHEVSYFDTWTKGEGEDSVSSDDGLDTILDFTAEDVLDFSGITKDQFLAHFNADTSGSAAGDASLNDTVITIDGVSNWSLTLADVQLSLTQVADQAVFS